MVNPHSYSRGTVTALALLSKGTCYWPDPPCPVPATVSVNGEPVFNLQIAHIRAANPHGPRYVAGMTDDERRAFANLIFLCTPHHLFVDKIRPERYPIAALEKWKADRERGELAQLSQQNSVTEDRLQEVIADALEAKLKDVRNAIARIEQTDSEAALLLRELADQMNAPTLNTEIAEALYNTASILAPILKEGNVNNLSSAAQSLAGMEETLNGLPRVIAQLQQLQGGY